MLLSLALTTLLSQTAPLHPVPAYLPRDLQLGLELNGAGAVSPTVRVGWQIGLIEQPRNDLLAVVELGTGAAVSLPYCCAALYQHVAMAGIGYSSTRERFHWGFYVVAGLLWYRATYDPATEYGVFPFESKLMGTSEGYGEVGLKVAPNLILGLRLGYSGGWSVQTRYPATGLLAGAQLAVFANWR